MPARWGFTLQWYTAQEKTSRHKNDGYTLIYYTKGNSKNESDDNQYDLIRSYRTTVLRSQTLRSFQSLSWRTWGRFEHCSFRGWMVIMNYCTTYWYTLITAYHTCNLGFPEGLLGQKPPSHGSRGNTYAPAPGKAVVDWAYKGGRLRLSVWALIRGRPWILSRAAFGGRLQAGRMK